MRHAPGGAFTTALFESMRPGALLRVEGPLGQFVYRPSDAPLLLIAGGTGYAPIKAMLRHVLETGIVRPVHLYWGVRDLPDLYEAANIDALCRRFPQLKFAAALSEPRAGVTPLCRRGWVHEIVLAEYTDLSAADIYVAGPPALVAAVRATFPPRGADPQRIAFDSFDYAPRLR